MHHEVLLEARVIFQSVLAALLRSESIVDFFLSRGSSILAFSTAVTASLSLGLGGRRLVHAREVHARWCRSRADRERLASWHACRRWNFRAIGWRRWHICFLLRRAALSSILAALCRWLLLFSSSTGCLDLGNGVHRVLQRVLSTRHHVLLHLRDRDLFNVLKELLW